MLMLWLPCISAALLPHYTTSICFYCYLHLLARPTDSAFCYQSVINSFWKIKSDFPKLFTSIKFAIHICMLCAKWLNTYTHRKRNEFPFHFMENSSGLTTQMQILWFIDMQNSTISYTQHRQSANYMNGIEIAEYAVDCAIEMTRDRHTQLLVLMMTMIRFCVIVCMCECVCHSLFRFHLNRFLIELSWPISLNT